MQAFIVNFINGLYHFYLSKKSETYLKVLTCCGFVVDVLGIVLPSFSILGLKPIKSVASIDFIISLLCFVL